jgi:hypothetical protein
VGIARSAPMPTLRLLRLLRTAFDVAGDVVMEDDLVEPSQPLVEREIASAMGRA